MNHGTCTYCSEMAKGLACNTKGLNMQTLPTRPGVFRTVETSNNTYPCLSRHWLTDDEHIDCVGGNVSAQCRPHHQGMLCMVCEEGFVRNGAGVQPCTLCKVGYAEAGGLYAGLTIFILGASAAFVYAMVRFLTKDAGPEATPESTSQATASRSLQNNLQAMSKLKIIVGWGQVSSSVDSTFSVPWPSSFRKMTDIMRNICNLDVVGFFAGFGCYFNNTFAVNFAVHMMTLPILLALIGVAWWIAQRKTAQVYQKTMKNRLVKTTALLTFLMYPGLGVKIFNVLKCMEIEGKLYFVADFSQMCFQNQHLTLTLFAVLFFSLYIVGMPAMLWWRLYRHREEIKQRFATPLHPHVEARFGHLYGPYEPTFWYGELIEMGKKLLLTAGLSMFAQDSVIQLLLGILISFAHLMYMMKKQPFVENLDNLLSQCSGVQIFLTLLIGLVLKTDRKHSQGLLDAVLVGLTVLVLVFGVFCLASIFQKPKFVDSCLNTLYGSASKQLPRFQAPETQLAVSNVEMTSGTLKMTAAERDQHCMHNPMFKLTAR